MSLFRCPICGAVLTREERSYRCGKNHCYDIAKEGYTHLLPVQQKHSQNPGDDKAMVRSRRAFLSKDYYAPLRRQLEELALRYTPANGAVLDSGCGEGYYTAAISRALTEGSIPHRLAAVDISKEAVRLTAKSLQQGECAVASVYHLPIMDGSIDFLLNCFSPLAIDEFRRVLKQGGHFAYVVPAAEHLWQMKEVLYDEPYPNEVKRTPYEGFRYVDVLEVRDTITLDNPEDIFALFQMTPYSWKTPAEGVARLKALQTLTTDIAFHIHLFEKE